MTPLARYKNALSSIELMPDPEQLQVIELLDGIRQELVRTPMADPQRGGLLSRWFGRGQRPVAVVKGLYLWGGVGRGKTRLTDMFYETVPFDNKSRLHFHHFMKMIHDELRPLKHIEDPLSQIAAQWIRKTRLLVLDEMHVIDITDAMLMGRLLGSMFERGMTLVTTSNVPPDQLYRDGLQRDRFKPAIEQIKQYTTVFNIEGTTDYRLRVLENADIYFDSADPGSRQRLTDTFERLCPPGARVGTEALRINGRDLPVVRSTAGLAWFRFDDLCNTPRSTLDYIEIATLFHTVLVSDLPLLDDTRNDEARRLVNLIDELYDDGVNLIVSAAAEPEGLYTGKRLAFEFVRAASRLHEMQTREYLSTRHR